MANHLRLDLNLVELLAGVDTNDGADHLGDNDHVTEVGLDEVGLLVGLGLLLRLAELLDETHGLALQTAVEATAGTGVDDITELLRREVEEPVDSVRWISLILMDQNCRQRRFSNRQTRDHWYSLGDIVMLSGRLMNGTCCVTI